jgi:hypothetical protein
VDEELKSGLFIHLQIWQFFVVFINWTNKQIAICLLPTLLLGIIINFFVSKKNGCSFARENHILHQKSTFRKINNFPNQLKVTAQKINCQYA